MSPCGPVQSKQLVGNNAGRWTQCYTPYKKCRVLLYSTTITISARRLFHINTNTHTHTHTRTRTRTRSRSRTRTCTCTRTRTHTDTDVYRKQNIVVLLQVLARVSGSAPGPAWTMAFVKVLKNAAYFKRFQVQKRRRREGKTDYHARRKMVRQDKNKFNNRKYRLVVRFTNKRVICQCVYATLRGDVIVAAAASNELAHFGIPAGHKNYAAAYATGLLVARRVLKKFGLDEKFKGKEEIDGEEYHVEDEDNEQRPFKCILDVGIRRTCVGHRMWGALKGAVDGGLHVPHKAKNFPGFKAADEKGGESEYDAEAHKEKIFGNHASTLSHHFLVDAWEKFCRAWDSDNLQPLWFLLPRMGCGIFPGGWPRCCSGCHGCCFPYCGAIPLRSKEQTHSVGKDSLLLLMLLRVSRVLLSLFAGSQVFPQFYG